MSSIDETVDILMKCAGYCGDLNLKFIQAILALKKDDTKAFIDAIHKAHTITDSLNNIVKVINDTIN